MDSCQFDIKFDQSLLSWDLAICLKTKWPVHFNQQDYSGTWSSISLRSASGSETDIHATANARYQDTPLLDRCPYFRSVMDWFHCEKEAVRLLSLSPGSFIREHRDLSSGYEDGFFRIHVPIQTNDSVVFRVNGQELKMLPGSCWYANFNLPHFVSNDGGTDRIHLVIDCIRNSWSDELFRRAGYDFEKEGCVRYDRATKLAMISQLSAMNSETAARIAQQLKDELAAEQDAL